MAQILKPGVTRLIANFINFTTIRLLNQNFFRPAGQKRDRHPLPPRPHFLLMEWEEPV